MVPSSSASSSSSVIAATDVTTDATTATTVTTITSNINMKNQNKKPASGIFQRQAKREFLFILPEPCHLSEGEKCTPAKQHH